MIWRNTVKVLFPTLAGPWRCSAPVSASVHLCCLSRTQLSFTEHSLLMQFCVLVLSPRHLCYSSSHISGLRSSLLSTALWWVSLSAYHLFDQSSLDGPFSFPSFRIRHSSAVNNLCIYKSFLLLNMKSALKTQICSSAVDNTSGSNWSIRWLLSLLMCDSLPEKH